MRSISAETVAEAVCQAVIEINTHLPGDIEMAMEQALDRETNPAARRSLQILLENARIAPQDQVPLCQDTGMVVAYVEVGQDVHISGGSLEAAVNQGIHDGYLRGYLRKSIVQDPFNRVNTGDNTPAIIHFHLVEGEALRILLAAKGAGSENMGQLAMLKPAAGIEGVKQFILKVVREAGSNPCPPIIVGVGVGGNMEKAASMAKVAVLRPVGEPNSQPELARLEAGMLAAINDLGIGVQGLGGATTALAVHIETFATHMASLPVAVNLGCHSTRRTCINL
ncbi:MAG: fumarate hydratase [Syntrophomonadaceae bacterium]|nr:fumarate hydratase [Syntrophomonadaceae bacterium]